MAAIVTAQRAFPFGSRVQFYRVLVGQTANLVTDVRTGAPLSTVAHDAEIVEAGLRAATATRKLIQYGRDREEVAQERRVSRPASIVL